MSQVINTATQFDRISRVYDETRDSLKKTTIDKIASVLLKDGCSSILEIGIGTGRVAKPLQDRDFRIVGLDISMGMLLKAKEKKIERLILADANHLPIRAKSFDAAILAHVLHIFENPTEVFRGVTGVVRKEVIALVRKRDAEPYKGSGNYNVIRQILQEAAAKVGYTLPSRRMEWRRKESELLTALPPTKMIDVQDELIETSIEDRLSYIEKRAFRFVVDIPDDVLQRIIREVRSSLPADAAQKKIQYRRTEQMAIWRLY
jgi:SAM-dependent methyltransferase